MRLALPPRAPLKRSLLAGELSHGHVTRAVQTLRVVDRQQRHRTLVHLEAVSETVVPAVRTTGRRVAQSVTHDEALVEHGVPAERTPPDPGKAVTGHTEDHGGSAQ